MPEKICKISASSWFHYKEMLYSVFSQNNKLFAVLQKHLLQYYWAAEPVEGVSCHVKLRNCT
jgi:hypothetical protein